ncbi:hypothetical protein B0T26DRAFT_647654 [Lasiosphaeria miniovina]|uniref:Translation initiation factor eIF2B subunit alpha n=1 Tax=Lasiosphaeria miniovina TaxID=1954250 RepID=A0AA40ALL1_9PEZI|nr:uncharacterized protein B0T26DRAFT_647654 [Lasiosphaeria miniovina]KAK0718097.1 hypothetical protein B0T26DRAFT_647654 [Lasiosphaeria miniovina]
MLWRRPLPLFIASFHFQANGKMATDDLDTDAGASVQLPIRAAGNTDESNSTAFDIVKTYRSLLDADPDLTMPVAAIESLIELLHATPSSTAMETVEVVKKEKAKLVASAPNPLPILAGADLFEQFLLRSLRGQTASGSADVVLSFDETRQHLLRNKLLFAERAKAARDMIAKLGSERVVDGGVVMTAGGSRVVTKILLHAAAMQKKQFKVIYVLDGSPRTDASVAALRDAGIPVETVLFQKVAYMLLNQSQINVVMVGTEVITWNGGVVSRMGTCQLAQLCKKLPGTMRRFFVVAESHKIHRNMPIAYPMVLHLGVRQRHIGRWENLANGSVRDLDGKPMESWLADQDEVEYTEPEFIDGFITEQGIKSPGMIVKMVEDYN